MGSLSTILLVNNKSVNMKPAQSHSLLTTFKLIVIIFTSNTVKNHRVNNKLIRQS